MTASRLLLVLMWAAVASSPRWPAAAAAAAATATSAACPPASSPFEESWSPLPWRAPLKLCRCAEGMFCRGPFCHASLDYTTNTTRWTAAVLGCGSRCACLPKCTDPLDCWADHCACEWVLNEQYLPRDPTAPHSPRAVADALTDALPQELLSRGSLDDRYRSPCWHSHWPGDGNRGGDGGAAIPSSELGGDGVTAAMGSHAAPLRCLPFAYIPGVLKCATSALYDTLEKHPQVCECNKLSQTPAVGSTVNHSWPHRRSFGS
jgi:hypothetical protein